MADSKLHLKGSSKMVADYFEFAINTILFQRGIYPTEDFITVRKYGLPMVINDDNDVKQYLARIMHQLKRWVYSKKMRRLVVVLSSKSTGEVIERWQFDLDVVTEGLVTEELKQVDAVQREIQTIMRQITSSASFLPQLNDDEYTFNVLAYTAQDIQVPLEWSDSDAKPIHGDHESVNFTSFDTNIHKVGTNVEYKLK
ncbi:mitotic spindle checkpoint component Mad2p [Diutina catenulata]